jgi:hypothetical protein
METGTGQTAQGWQATGKCFVFVVTYYELIYATKIDKSQDISVRNQDKNSISQLLVIFLPPDP